MSSRSQTTGVIYAPQRRVLTHKVLAVSVVGFLCFGVSVLMRFHERDWAYFRETFPVHLMLAGMIAAYLVYLNYALFRSLADGYRVVRSEDGLTVHGEGTTRSLPWASIRRIRFGDLYLKIDTKEGALEIPFIPRGQQTEIFRHHQRAMGFTPDAGRFLPHRVRPTRSSQRDATP